VETNTHGHIVPVSSFVPALCSPFGHTSRLGGNAVRGRLLSGDGLFLAHDKGVRQDVQRTGSPQGLRHLQVVARQA